MKLATAGIAGAILVLTAGLSGCGSDTPPPTPKTEAEKAAAAAKAAPPKPAAPAPATAAATSTGAEAARVSPKAAAASSASTSASTPEPLTTSTKSDKSTSGSTASNSSTSSTGTTADSGYNGGGYGGGYGYDSGMGATIGSTVGTVGTTDPAATNVKSALIAKAQALSTHLLVTGLTYKTRDGSQQTFDAYLPVGYATATSGPYAFVVHGGDWSEGAKEDVRLYAIALAQKGIVAIAPNYRLAPTNIHPAQVNDLADAMAYIETNPTVLFTTGTSYGAVGVAAGGQLASLVALSPNASGHLKCVSAVFAPTDLTNLSGFDSVLKAYLGTNYSPAAVMAVSPVYQIASRAANPSFYLSHGTADVRVPYAQSDTFASELKRNGLSATLKAVEGAGHAYTEEQTKAVATDIATFTATCLGL